MDSEKTTTLLVDTARRFTRLLREAYPDWTKGYLRLSASGMVAESKASFVRPDGVEIVDVLKHASFFHEVSAVANELLAVLCMPEGVFLLIVDSKLDYEVRFEYVDQTKWRISKLGGGSGIPEGLDEQAIGRVQ